MTPDLIRKEVKIQAPVAVVWRYVSSPEGMRQWWGQEIWFEAKQGGRCVEQGRLHGKPCQWEGVVTRYDPPHQLMLTLQPRSATYQAVPEVSTISITLEAMQRETLVKVEHKLSQILPLVPAVSQPWPVYRRSVPDHSTILNQLPLGNAPGNTPQDEYGVDLTDLLPPIQDVAGWKTLEAQWTSRLDALSHLADA